MLAEKPAKSSRVTDNQTDKRMPLLQLKQDIKENYADAL